jgi:hypothetical protein
VKVRLLAVIFAALWAGCNYGAPPRSAGELDPKPGSALGSRDLGETTVGVSHGVPVGEEWLVFFSDLKNHSDHPLTLKSARLVPGVGLASVVRVKRIEIGVVTIPGGLYSTYPPVSDLGEGCVVLETHPVAGYVLGPGEEARFLVWLRAEDTGDFRADSHEAVYEQGGDTFVERLPQSIEGTVSESAKGIRLYEEEKRCLPEGGRLLP